jgi:hypothetical protein
MSTFFRGITETVPSLFRGIFSERTRTFGQFIIMPDYPEVVDMNGRFQMQGGKNWFLPKEMNANRFFWDSLAGYLVKPVLSLYGIEWRERGYGLGTGIRGPQSGTGMLGVPD